MDNTKNYTVMELAELIGVPRTTINDWLNRYGQYILSIPQGKRKVYPESAVRVLQEIAALRNQGESFARIEKILGENYPIKAEFVVPSPESESTVPGKESGESRKNGNQQEISSSGAMHEPAKESVPPAQEFALIARRQSEEITRMIGDSFRNMDERIRELEEIARTRKKMSCIWFGAFLIFLLLLGAVSLGAWHFLEKREKENLFLLNRNTEKDRSIAALREQSVALIAESKNFKANAARLEKELKKQQKEFEISIQAQRKDLLELYKAREQSLDARWKQSQAQIRESQIRQALEKERFAAERLALLRKMELLEKKYLEEKKKNEKKTVPRKAPEKKLKKTPVPKKVNKKAPSPAKEKEPSKSAK